MNTKQTLRSANRSSGRKASKSWLQSRFLFSGLKGSARTRSSPHIRLPNQEQGVLKPARWTLNPRCNHPRSVTVMPVLSKQASSSDIFPENSESGLHRPPQLDVWKGVCKAPSKAKELKQGVKVIVHSEFSIYSQIKGFSTARKCPAIGLRLGPLYRWD